MFIGRAREQAERILTYAAAGGIAALVDEVDGDVKLSVGGWTSDLQASSLIALRASGELVIATSKSTLVGRVGSGLALIVVMAPTVPVSSISTERVAKACELLARMTAHLSSPPNDSSGGGSGAPAEAFDFLPPDWKR